MSVTIEVSGIENNPYCPHGPTVRFSRNSDKRKYFACSACRDRKDCNFFMYIDEVNKISRYKKEVWEKEKEKYIGNMNHIKQYLTFNKIKQLCEFDRVYCVTCNEFQLPKFKEKHHEHIMKTNITDYYLSRPSEFLVPLDNPKKEAQYLFSKVAVETIVNILRERNVRIETQDGTFNVRVADLNDVKITEKLANVILKM